MFPGIHIAEMTHVAIVLREKGTILAYRLYFIYYSLANSNPTRFPRKSFGKDETVYVTA